MSMPKETAIKGGDLAMIIDGHGLTYRAYYALERQNLRDPISGAPTQAIHGFFKMFIKLLKDFRPSHLAIAWDTPQPTFRKALFPQYKSTRKPTPPDLIEQVKKIKDFVHQCGFLNSEAVGYEADDIIGTLSTDFSSQMPVLIISSDKDCFQLIDANINLLRPQKGVSDFLIIDEKWVRQEIGVTVAQICDYMALMGDSSDNIPGVKGIGKKSAANLLEKFSSLDQIYANLQDVAQTGIQNKLREGKESAYLSRKLVDIKTDMAMIKKIDAASLKVPKKIQEKGIRALKENNFPQISGQLAAWQSDGKKASFQTFEEQRLAQHREYLQENKKYQMISSLAELKKVFAVDKKNSQQSEFQYWAIDTETTGLNTKTADLVGISLCTRTDEAYYLPLRSKRLEKKLLSKENQTNEDEELPFVEEYLEYEPARKILTNFFGQKNIRFIGQNIRYDLEILRNHGFAPLSPYFDTMIASYLCRPNVRRHNLTDMTRELLKQDKLEYKDLDNKKNSKQIDLSQVPPSMIAQYACEDADVTYQLFQLLDQQITEKKMQKILYEIEMPLITVLLQMEAVGVTIDTKYLKELSLEYQGKIDHHEKEIYKLVGHSFNVFSTREVQQALFETLGLPKKRKIKTGYSTDQQVLESLRGQHPVIEDILEHRKYSKLLSTYVDSLIKLADQDQRVHTTYSQTIAATGRLSSFKPNLQNIPRQDTSGRSIRRAFIAEENHSLLVADYSQIELRIMAHCSGDKTLIQSYTDKSIDIHAQTAAAIFNLPVNQINKKQRNIGKTINFSIIYGVTEYGLAKSLSIEIDEARIFIERFFVTYPKVKEYMDKTIASAKKNGYVATLMGRRRPIPDIDADQLFVRQAAQRMAINAPIQGTSADIIKVAMIHIQQIFKGEATHRQFQSKMILQVHDELLFQVADDEKDDVFAIVKKKMESATTLAVPLVVNCGWGRNWDEAQNSPIPVN